MNFVQTHYLLLIVSAFILVFIYFLLFTKSYLKWVKDNWFYFPNIFFYLSKGFYFFFFFLLLISLLDLRGPEEKVVSNIPDQQTLILLDVSSSMLAEDLRPSRFQKALLLARHFVKTSAGHQISLVLFSDFQKRIVPFTDDIDLLEARLAGLSDLDIRTGGSNLTQAISESVRYFAEEGKKNNYGNILVFTDSEEHEDQLELKVPDSLSVAIVGLGTLKGAPIPLRDRTGIFRGNKSFKGQDVISKLDENILKKFSSKIKNYKYWIATSYSIPTEEVLQFFKSRFIANMNTGDILVRPVLAHYLLIPSIIFWILYFLAGRMKQFKALTNFLILISLICSSRLFAEDKNNLSKEDTILFSEINKKLSKGKIRREDRNKLAELFLKKKDNEKAILLYKEAGKGAVEDQINLGTSLLHSGKRQEGLLVYSDVIKKIKSKNKLTASDEKNLEIIRNNTLIQSSKQEQKEKGQSEDKKENDDKKDKNNKNSENQSDNQQNKSQQDKKTSDDKKNKDEEQKDKEKEKGKDKENKPEEGDKKEEQEKNDPKDLEEKEKQIKQQRNMVKVPALLKQLMNSDRNLQKKMFDTTTQQGKTYDKKDW